MDNRREQVLAGVEEEDSSDIQYELGWQHLAACMTKPVFEEPVRES